MADSLRTYSEECVRNVEIASAEIDVLLRRENETHFLERIFNLCDSLGDSINNPKDISTFFDVLAGHFAVIAQYNKESLVDGSVTIDTICEMMVDETLGQRVSRLAAVNRLIVTSHGYGCLSFKYRRMLDYLTQTNRYNSRAAISGGRYRINLDLVILFIVLCYICMS